MFLPQLDHRLVFPPVTQALHEPDGLLAHGGDLCGERLLAAYRAGIFPWYNPGQPILWWSPDPRMVLLPNALHVPRSLDKVMRARAYEVRYDTAFAEVIAACAHSPRPGQRGTWLSGEMIAAYCALHHAGWAHSVECWIDGELAGGLYGLAIGQVFYGESMFARRADASKIAFVHGVRQWTAAGCQLIDCQVYTDHLARFGAREIPRADFLARLAAALAGPPMRLFG